LSCTRVSIRKLDNGDYQIIMSKPEITILTDDIYNIKEHLTGLHALSEFDSRVSDVVSDEEG
jgi:hypothetical protein